MVISISLLNTVCRNVLLIFHFHLLILCGVGNLNAARFPCKLKVCRVLLNLPAVHGFRLIIYIGHIRAMAQHLSSVFAEDNCAHNSRSGV